MGKGSKPKATKRAAGKKSSGAAYSAATLVAVLAVGAYLMTMQSNDADGTGSGSGAQKKKWEGSGLTSHRSYDYDPHDINNMNVYGADELAAAGQPKERMKRAGSKVWEEARKKLISNPKAVQIGVNPEVFVIPSFLSDEECDEVLELHKKRFEEANQEPKWCFSPNYHKLFPPGLKTETGDFPTDKCIIKNPKLGQEIADKRERSQAFSRSVMVGRGENDNEIVDLIGKRVEENAMHEDYGYHTQILEYKQGEDYRVHTDCNNAENDRAATLLIYLKDTDEGGETTFPRQRVAVKPAKGTAVFFGSLDENGKCSDRSDHTAAPVMKGGKTVIQRWYYERNLGIPGGKADHVLCDKGQNCRHYMFWNNRTEAYVHEERGIALSDRGDKAGAAKEYEKAVKTNFLQPLSNALLAETYAKTGRKEEAATMYESALQVAPGMQDTLYMLGQLYQEAGEYTKAQRHFQRLVGFNPRDRDAFFLLGQVIEAQVSQDSAHTDDGKALLKKAKRAYRSSAELGDADAKEAVARIDGKLQ